MEKCTSTRKHKISFTIKIYSRQCNYSKKRLLFYRLEKSAKTTDQRSKTTVDQRKEDNCMQNGQLRTSRCSKDIHQFWKRFVLSIATAKTRQVHLSSPVLERSDGRVQETGAIPQKPKTKIIRGMTVEMRMTVCEIFLSGWRSSQILWRTQKCMHPHTVSGLRFGTFHESGIKIKEAQYLFHFPKDRNCEVCLRTKMTRAPCRRRTGEALPRAENIGDLITGDHKVLNEEGESRDNHWCAVIVQDLATQWIQSYPCKTKTSQETERSLRKFLEPSQKPKVIYTDNSLKFGKSCEVLAWNHRTSTPHRSETTVYVNTTGQKQMALLKEQYDE